MPGGSVPNSLSARLLILTVLFVMLAEVLIFLPSVARFRDTWLTERLGTAHLAVLALDATPDGMVSEALQDRLLTFAGVRSIALRRGGAKIALLNDMPPAVDAGFDLTREGPVEKIRHALALLASDGDAVFRVVGRSPKNPAAQVEVVFDEGPLCDAIVGYAGRILVLSLVISIITATLVFLALRWQMVRPMRRLTDHMVRFRENPEDASRMIRPTRRGDEIGQAERELAAMQKTLLDTLSQRRHLAALGTAMAKIQHDLRGILSSALLVSDRLENSADPEVQRVTPTLVSSIERAVKLSSQTLDYAGRQDTPQERTTVPLAALIADAGAGMDEATALDNRVGGTLAAEADRDQIFRAANNLLRNAADAGATRVTVTGEHAARADGWDAALSFADDGPGLPPRAQEKLFQPFEGSGRAGGAGLGLAIARELARDNGGDLTLVRTGPEGTVFRLTLPAAKP